MNIIKALEDRNLFQPFLGDLTTWGRWFSALRALYGLPLNREDRQAIRQHTGRKKTGKLPQDGFRTALFLTGRRSGKSRVSALIGAYEALFAGHETRLARGEQGLVAICAPSKRQARVVRAYLEGIFDAPMLRNEIVGTPTREGFQLRNGIKIEILAGDFRTVRSFTLVAAIVDEIAFFGLDDENKIKSDSELIRALKPGLLTTGGKLIGISSKYAKRGWCYRTWKKWHGNDAARTLVWDATSREMNATLPQEEIDAALEDDPAAARSEYLNEWREDVSEFVPRLLIESLAIPGRKELIPYSVKSYFGFVDMSGGRVDDSVLAIAHKQNGKILLDKICQYKPPFNPHEVIRSMVEELRRFGITEVTGDNYAADFVKRSFEGQGVRYTKSDKPKSELYRETLPVLCTGNVELLDNEVMINQFAGLERKTRSGGKDKIDHLSGGKDDVSNAVAGVIVSASVRKNKVGVLFNRFDSKDDWY